jgi:sugar lactone lactonase YvrE
MPIGLTRTLHSGPSDVVPWTVDWLADGSMLVVPRGRSLLMQVSLEGAVATPRLGELGKGTPDGICTDREDAVWYADVPNSCCVRVRDGGESTQVVQLDRAAFSCALAGPERRTLHIAATIWQGADTFTANPPNGQLIAVDVDIAAAGWPSP